MKKWYLILLILFSSLTAFNQRNIFFGLNREIDVTPPAPNYPYFGVWGYGSNPSNTAMNAFQTYNCKGVQFLYDWKDIEPTKNNKDFSAIQSDLQRSYDRGMLYNGIQINAGNAAPITAPENWLVTTDGVGTFMTTGGVSDGAWPDYYNTNYNIAYQSLYTALFAYLNSLPQYLKDIVLYVKVVWGYTGDAEPYKGTCVGTCFGIADDDTWNNYIRVNYAVIHGIYETSGATYNLAMNADNDAKNLTWLTSNYPNDFVKKGDLGHDYYFDFENLHPKAGYISMSEVQGYVLVSAHQKQEVLPLICSGLSDGLKIQNLVPQWVVTDAVTKQVSDFFNEMVSQQYTPSATKGFIMLAQKISFGFNNTYWLSEAQYGQVIGNIPAYNQQIAAINADTSFGEEYKRWLRAYTEKTKINTTRVSNLTNALTKPNQYANYSTTANDFWNNDYGYSLKENYSLNVTQNNIHNTSLGRYRIAQSPDTSIYGRYGAEFIINAGAGSMSFDIDNTWSNSSSSANVSFDIVYLNSGTGSWSFQANTGSGMADVATQTNTNTGLWLHKLVTVNNMQLGSSEDFKLRYTTGNNTIYCMITFRKILSQ